MGTKCKIFVILFLLVLFLLGQKERVLYAQTNAAMVLGINNPMGTARGIFPGRVVWVHDTLVAKWDGVNGYWWDDKYTSQIEVNRIIVASLTSLTGESQEDKSWDKLFRHFNATKRNIDKGFSKDEKIAIKINEVIQMHMQTTITLMLHLNSFMRSCAV